MATISNLISSRGNKVANQFQINGNGFSLFQSYSSLIAAVVRKEGERKVLLTNKWDYSRTTAKYLYIFLRGNGFNLQGCKDVHEAIDNGDFLLIEEAKMKSMLSIS